MFWCARSARATASVVVPMLMNSDELSGIRSAQALLDVDRSFLSQFPGVGEENLEKLLKSEALIGTHPINPFPLLNTT